MKQKEYKRPDETVLLQIMDSNRKMLAETLIVLAWKLGLTREEIYNLKWEDLSFEEQQLKLPDRSVPMDEDTCQRLQERWYGRGRLCEYVAANDRDSRRVHMGYIPICVRKALDRGGLTDINMIDLRQDFVIRQLEQHDWTYVARITGMAATTLFGNYHQHVRSIRGKHTVALDATDEEEKLRTLIQTEGTSVEGLALRLSWEVGLPLKTIAALTWEEVDFESGNIRVNGETWSMSSEVSEMLQTARAERDPEEDPHVLLTPHSRKPYETGRLSIVIKNALIRGGIENLTAVELQQKKWQAEGDAPIFRLLEQLGYVTRNDVMKELHLTQHQAYGRLQRLVEQKKLAKVGTRYHRPGDVIADPEAQYRAVRGYLEREGMAYRQELMELLGVEARQCSWILRGMVESGRLEKVGQRYRLPTK